MVVKRFESFFRNISSVIFFCTFCFPSLSLFSFVVLREILHSRSVHSKITHSNTNFYTDFIASISKSWILFTSSSLRTFLSISPKPFYAQRKISFHFCMKRPHLLKTYRIQWIIYSTFVLFFFLSLRSLCSWNWNKYLNWKKCTFCGDVQRWTHCMFVNGNMNIHKIIVYPH